MIQALSRTFLGEVHKKDLKGICQDSIAPVLSSTLCGYMGRTGRLHNIHASLLLLVMLLSSSFSFVKGKQAERYSKMGDIT